MGLQNIAASAAAGTKAAVGAAAAINIVTNTTEAFLDANAQSDATGATSITAHASYGPVVAIIPIPLIGANVSLTLSSLAIAGGVSTGNAAVGGSVIVDVLTFHTHAYIGNGAKVNLNTTHGPNLHPNQSLTISATDDTAITNGAGGLGVAIGTAGIGIGIVVDVVNKDDQAYIGTSADVLMDGSVSISAITTEPVLLIAASAGGAGTVGIAGSIVVFVLDQGSDSTKGTRAFINAASIVHAGGSMTLVATDNADPANDQTQLYAGGLAFGGTAGVGVSITTLVKTTTVDASIGAGSDITAKGGAGLSVTALQTENVFILAVAGGGGGTAGVAGSASIDVMNDTTKAHIDSSSHVDATSAVAGADARHRGCGDRHDDHQGNLRGTRHRRNGGRRRRGRRRRSITKDTEAYLGSGVVATATQDVTVLATSSENILSVSAGIAAGGDVAIAVNASVSGHLARHQSLHRRRLRRVRQTAASRSSANEQTKLDAISGNLSVSGTASIGAAAGVPVIKNKQTLAYIGQGAQVTALGNDLAGLTVDDGHVHHQRHEHRVRSFHGRHQLANHQRRLQPRSDRRSAGDVFQRRRQRASAA